nr:MAG: hypothetical protein DIU58_12330 [Sphaerobacter thermophilus]
MAKDDFAGQMHGLLAPTDDFELVVPDDGHDLPRLPRRLWVAESGNLVVTNRGGDTVTIPVEAGQEVPIRPHRVLESTTATVVALY